jgi:hypothetical protein
MEIKPTYVTFEQAKWIRDVIKSEAKYDENGFLFHSKDYHLSGSKFNNSISAPEQWQVIEWLRVNHGIHLGVSCDAYGKFWYANLNVCSKEVWEDEDKRHNILSAHFKFNNEHKSPQEAYSAAFDYILNNLISDTVNVKLTLWQKFINSLPESHYNLFSKNPNENKN